VSESTCSEANGGEPRVERSDQKSSPICVRVDCAMQMLGIGKTKIYELFSEGELETIHIGRRTLVLRDSIDRMIERFRQSQGPS
jgi:excisionase family DNA binding protein